MFNHRIIVIGARLFKNCLALLRIFAHLTTQVTCNMIAIMNVQDIIWLPEIEEKLWRKHNVWLEEVEAVLFDKPKVRFIERGHRQGENLYAAYGQTEAGRYLTVFFILKSDKRALIITAREMDRKERRRYGRRTG